MAYYLYLYIWYPMNQTKSTDKKHKLAGKCVLSLLFFTFGFSQWAYVNIKDSFTSTDLRTFIESTTFGLYTNPSIITYHKKRNGLIKYY